MPNKVLIANRGEIAIRIARSLHELDSKAVAVFTEIDRQSLHLRFADEALGLGEDPRAYLDVERIVDAARRSGADALHPGYGFLSENAELAEACERAGITFIGPSASAIRAMGSKPRARSLMSAAGVPVVPGGPASSFEEASATARTVGYPVMVKATDGGGGKGMRRVESEAELASALERTASEAEAAFGNRGLYLEKAIDRPRHVEIQILGDRHGRLVQLFERDCSIQRRHQKVLEETPCAVLPESVLEQMSAVALRAAEAIGYYSAGTIEFLLAPNGDFYFLEMNTRLQVEHPITELVTGVDLVKEMIRVAFGERLTLEPTRRGAAIEVRLNAEDPRQGFLPSPGRIERFVMPAGPGVRVDSGVTTGSIVSPYYDPLLAKLVVWAEDRPSAVRRLRRALSECVVLGLRTNLDFLRDLAEHPLFFDADYDTGFLGRTPELGCSPLPADAARELAMALATLAAEAPAPTRSTARDAALSPWVSSERARLR